MGTKGRDGCKEDVREKARRRSETAEQREDRVRQRRPRDRATHAVQTVEQRDLALHRRRINLCDQETVQQPEAR